MGVAIIFGYQYADQNSYLTQLQTVWCPTTLAEQISIPSINNISDQDYTNENWDSLFTGLTLDNYTKKTIVQELQAYKTAYNTLDSFCITGQNNTYFAITYIEETSNQDYEFQPNDLKLDENSSLSLKTIIENLNESNPPSLYLIYLSD